MFGLFKANRARAAQEEIANRTRKTALRLRLHETLQAAASVLISDHKLGPDAANEVLDNTNQVKNGIDLVLVNDLDAYQSDIPEHSKGGAIIAHSADAFSGAASTLQDTDLEQSIGSVRDIETIGHMFYQLGYTRDGTQKRPDAI